jgi:hypothetical protein
LFSFPFDLSRPAYRGQRLLEPFQLGSFLCHLYPKNYQISRWWSTFLHRFAPFT